jgi:hypothetical protein
VAHRDRGRDPGPFANPAHFYIIAGLAGLALAGAVSAVLAPRERLATSLRFSDTWHVPVGGPSFCCRASWPWPGSRSTTRGTGCSART